MCGETENLRLLRLSATQAGRTGARAARSSGGWMLHNGPLRLTLTRRVVPVLSQNRELPWGGLAQVRGRKGSACSDNAIEEVAKHSGDRAAVPSAHRGRRRCTSSHRKTLSLWGAVAARTSPLPHPLLYPAATLGVCTTVLKKVCRRHGIRRWPQRKLQSLNKLINNLHNAMKSTNGAACSPPLPVADARRPRVRHTPLVWRRRQHTSAHPSRPLPSSCGGAPASRLRDR